MILFSFVFRYAVSSKDKLLLINGYEELKTGTANNLSSKNLMFEKFVFDNSYWTELQDATYRKDTSWITTNFAPSFSIDYNFDYLWVLNEKEELFYQKNIKNFKDVPLFDINKNELMAAIKKHPFKKFYTKFENNLIQVIIAPVHPTTDPKRLTKPKGYLISGKKYDAGFLNEFNKVSPSTNFSISYRKDNIDTIDFKNYIASYQEPLFDFYGKKIGVFKAERQLVVIAAYNDNLKLYTLLFIAFVFLLLLCYYYFLRIKVLNPVEILSKALQKTDRSNLGILKKKKDEFADLAHLIDDFFVKSNMLEREIKLRISTEKELKKAAIELENATIEKIRAEQDKIAKSTFLSTMSHEIRTPINGVIGVANLLKNEKLTPSQTELINTLSFSSSHLLSILTDILDFSKIETGNLEFDKIQFNLKEICRNVNNLYEPNANEKGIKINVYNDESVSDYLEGDSVRLCQILNNLMGNAVKFTENGFIEIGYTLVERKDNKETIAFSVKDTGIGIQNDKLDTIFNSFSQANRTITSNYGGTGLGLTITKKLIELQGGKITVDSKLNEGTNFTFVLTFDIVNTLNYQTEKIPKEQSVSNLNGLKVLIAEDNKINATILSKFLDKWNVQLALAVNGKEAMDMLALNEYDLVLMDLHMPVMDGRAAVNAIRSNNQFSYQNIPIVALTADATSETQREILLSGFNEYVTKPFDPKKLYNVLEKYAKA